MNPKQNIILFIGLLLIFLNLSWGGQWSAIWSIVGSSPSSSGG